MEDNLNFSEKFSIFLREKKKIIISFIILILIILIGTNIFLINQKNKTKDLAEKFISAGILASSKENEKAKILYKEIVLSKNKFYSILSLNQLIEKNLMKDQNEILNLFDLVETIKMDNEQKNLVKLKKALLLMKMSKNENAKKLLQEIIVDQSSLTNVALELSKN